jgi:hypothetical protein
VKTEEILSYCIDNLKGTVLVNSWGESGIFYNPNNTLKRGIYILTVKEKDGDNDKSSDLNREGIYRVNIGVRKSTFTGMFGYVPARPSKGGTVDMPYDFTQTDKLLPHPVYAWMSWLCVLNPSAATFEQIKPLIKEAYEYAKEKYSKRK